jgi:chromatin remodeling complex protein RSC6
MAKKVSQSTNHKKETSVSSTMSHQVPDVKEKAKPKPKPKPKPKEETVQEETVQEETVQEETVQEETSDTSVVNTVVLTRDSVLEDIDNLIKDLNNEVTNKELSKPCVKYLKGLNKTLKSLKMKVSKVTKNKKVVRKLNNTNSGFLKPVKISKELAKFTGWDPAVEKSRVDVTKYICNYIKDNNLQNPEDRRQIQVEKDPKFKKLLEFDSSSGVLTYYSLQTFLKKHFITNK